MSEVNPNEKKKCPECHNSALLKEWTLIEETIDGLIFQCPHCREKMGLQSMETVDDT